MERKKASDFRQELLNLFNRYVHGELRRRDFLDGAQKFAAGGVTAAALFQMLKPNYAWAIQIPADDKRIKAEYDMGPKLIQLRCRPEMRWPADANLDGTTRGTAKSGKSHRDLAEKRGDHMIPVVLHAANAATA